jgi:hypothetical protein
MTVNNIFLALSLATVMETGAASGVLWQARQSGFVIWMDLAIYSEGPVAV